MVIEITKEEAECIIDAINTSHLPTKRYLGMFKSKLQEKLKE